MITFPRDRGRRLGNLALVSLVLAMPPLMFLGAAVGSTFHPTQPGRLNWGHGIMAAVVAGLLITSAVSWAAAMYRANRVLQPAPVWTRRPPQDPTLDPDFYPDIPPLPMPPAVPVPTTERESVRPSVPVSAPPEWPVPVPVTMADAPGSPVSAPAGRTDGATLREGAWA